MNPATKLAMPSIVDSYCHFEKLVHRLLYCLIMTHSPPAARRKAVWGLKRTGAALLLLFSLATPALASGPHVKKAAVKHAGAASRAVKAYKTDDEVSRRATDTNLRNTTPVIVEPVSGA